MITGWKKFYKMQNYKIPDSAFIRNSFDSITPCYDRLNQILSFGMAASWRERSAEMVLGDPSFHPKTILDLGCGTGKFLQCFLQMQKWDHVVGVDFSPAMLQKARETLKDNIVWLQEDFGALPFLEESFDLIVSAFTLRSIQDLPEFMNRVYRILTPGGKAAFLDLTRPHHLFIRLLFYPYLRFFLPLMGWLISGNRMAYDFLSESVRSFQRSEKTIHLMETAGFKDCLSKSFSFGAVTLIIGKK